MQNSDEIKQRKIYEIVDNFDFEKVHKAMVATNHKWMSSYGEFQMQIPSIGAIVFQLIGKLDRAIDEYLSRYSATSGVYTVSSGGFHVSVYENENIDPDETDPYYITVKFCIAEEEA